MSNQTQSDKVKKDEKYRAIDDQEQSQDLPLKDTLQNDNLINQEGKYDTHNPKLGALYMQVVSIFQSLNCLAIKFVYIKQPTMTAIQILYFRSLICTLITLVFVNKDLKNAMITDLPRDQIFNLFLRCLQGMLVKGLQFWCLKCFKITTVAMFVSLGPVFTLIMGYLFLKENIKLTDIVQIVLSFGAIILITLSLISDKEEENKTNQKTITDDSMSYARRDHATVFAFVLLSCVPIGMATQFIILRKMKKLSNSNTISCYVNLFSMFGCLIVLIAQGEDFYKFIFRIVTTDFMALLLFIFIGSSTIVQQKFKFKALRHDQATKLSIWSYLETPYQFFFELILIHSYINGYQFLGFGLLCIACILKVQDILKTSKKLKEDEQNKINLLELTNSEQSKEDSDQYTINKDQSPIIKHEKN